MTGFQKCIKVGAIIFGTYISAIIIGIIVVITLSIVGGFVALSSDDWFLEEKDYYEEYKNVQSHAEPVYWLASNKLQVDKNNKVAVNETEMYRTYYVCEISWTETTKETDIFYILAQNAS